MAFIDSHVSISDIAFVTEYQLNNFVFLNSLVNGDKQS